MNSNPFKKTSRTIEEETGDEDTQPLDTPREKDTPSLECFKTKCGLLNAEGSTINVGAATVTCPSEDVARSTVATLMKFVRDDKGEKMHPDFDCHKLSPEDNKIKNKKVFEMKQKIRKLKDFDAATCSLQLNEDWRYSETKKTIVKPKPPTSQGADLQKQLEELQRKLKEYEEHDKQFTRVKEQVANPNTEPLNQPGKPTKEALDSFRRELGLI